MNALSDADLNFHCYYITQNISLSIELCALHVPSDSLLVEYVLSLSVSLTILVAAFRLLHWALRSRHSCIIVRGISILKRSLSACMHALLSRPVAKRGSLWVSSPFTTTALRLTPPQILLACRNVRLSSCIYLIETDNKSCSNNVTVFWIGISGLACNCRIGFDGGDNVQLYKF